MPIVAVAGLGFVADAIVAIIVLLAIIAVAYLVQRFGSYIPLVGGWLAAQAVRFLTLVRDALSPVYKGYVWALQTVTDAFVISVTYPLAKVLDGFNATVGAVFWLRNVAIPRWFNAAITFANQAAAAAYAYALSLYYQAVGFAQQVAAAAYAYSLALYQQAITYAGEIELAAYAYSLSLYYAAEADLAALDGAVRAEIASLATVLAGELAEVRAWALALIGIAVTGVEADIAATEQRVTALIEQYAAAAVKDALTITDQASAVALTDIWPHLVTDVEGLINEIPREIIDIRDEIAAIPRAIPASLVDALSALGVLAIPLLRYLRECGVPMCRDLHGLTNMFNDLNSVATDAALIGLFALMVANPHEAADVITGTLGPVAHGAATVTRDLVGV